MKSFGLFELLRPSREPFAFSNRLKITADPGQQAHTHRCAAGQDGWRSIRFRYSCQHSASFGLQLSITTDLL